MPSMVFTLYFIFYILALPAAQEALVDIFQHLVFVGVGDGERLVADKDVATLYGRHRSHIGDVGAVDAQEAVGREVVFKRFHCRQ